MTACLQIWPVVHTQLAAKGLKSVSPKEAQKMQAQGWKIVDVRIDGDFDRSHAAGASQHAVRRVTAES